MTGYLVAAFLALAGVVLAAVIGRKLSPCWAPGVTGGVTGGFGVGALRIAGLGDLGLLAMAGVLIVYGAIVGAAVALAGRIG